jgi:hypothetical protein
LDMMAQRFTEPRLPAPWSQVLLVVWVLGLAAALSFCRFFPGRVMGVALEWWGNYLDATFLPIALHNLNRLLLVSILVLMVVFFGLRRRLARTGGILLLVLLTLDLFLGNRGFVTRLDSHSFHAETEIIRTIKGDTRLSRFHVLPAVRKIEVPTKSYEEYHRVRKEFLGYDLMMEHHLFDIEGYNVPLQLRYENFIWLVRGKPLEDVQFLLNLMNVKYVLSDGPIDLPGYVWVRDGLESSKLYENRNCLPRALLVNNFQVFNDDDPLLQTLKDGSFDPWQTVLLESVPTRFLDLKKEPVIPPLNQEVRVLAYETNRMVIEATAPEAGFLFMSEAYFPGWQAYVDGRKEEILRANYVFRAIPLGPGSHRVELVCRPLSFRLGLVLSLLTLFSLLTAWLFCTRRGRVRLTGYRGRE